MKNVHIDVDDEGAWIEMRDDKETLEFSVKDHRHGSVTTHHLTREQVKELRDNLTVFLKSDY